MKFRKKPVVVEARQFAEQISDHIASLEAWCGGKYDCIDLGNGHEDVIKIQTLEGEMAACVGDWIIKGTQGEFYPCKPDAFDDVYEPVD